jgi:hypothetical protein
MKHVVFHGDVGSEEDRNVTESGLSVLVWFWLLGIRGRRRWRFICTGFRSYDGTSYWC